MAYTDEELLERFKTLLAEQKQAHQQAMDEIKKLGGVDPETKERIAKLETAQTELAAQVQKEFTGIKDRLTRPPGQTGPPAVQSVGHLVANSDNFKNTPQNGHFRIQITVNSSFATKATITEAGSGYPITPARQPMLSSPDVPLAMRNLLTTTSIGATNSIDYVIDTWTLNADYQLNEGDKKAESGVAYTVKTANVRTIAHFVKISRQMAADVPGIMASIDNRLRYGVLLKEDKELLYGDGTPGKILGIMPQAQAMVGGGGTATTVLDDLLLGIIQVANNGYVPTDIVMNAADYGGIVGLKTLQGAYLFPGPPVGSVGNRVWGLPVTTTPNIVKGEYLVGSFPANAELFDRETVTVDIAYENEDDFVKNLVTIRAEERIAFAVYAPNAFVKGTIPVAPPLTRGTGEPDRKR